MKKQATALTALLLSTWTAMAAPQPTIRFQQTAIPSPYQISHWTSHTASDDWLGYQTFDDLQFSNDETITEIRWQGFY
ncbi:MAG: hypothetical protein ACR2RV_28605, partial [Verrucomicrobiales bacterium]